MRSVLVVDFRTFELNLVFPIRLGVVLKKATKVGNGKCLTNLALGDCVDTLIVLSSDLVQVVVKVNPFPYSQWEPLLM